MEIPELRDVNYASERIKMSTRWLYTQARLGRVECTRMGQKVFWTDAQIAKIIKDAERKAAEKSEPSTKKAGTSSAAQANRKQSTSPSTHKHKTASSSKTAIPQADFGVSRLYKKGAA